MSAFLDKLLFAPELLTPGAKPTGEVELKSEYDASVWLFRGDSSDLGRYRDEGVINGAVTFNATKWGQSAQFLTSSDFIQINNPSIIFSGGESITLRVAITPTDVDTNTRFILENVLSTDNTKVNYALRHLSNGVIDFYYRQADDFAWHLWRTSSSVLSVNRYTIIEVRYTYADASSIETNINGKPVSGSWVLGDGTIAPNTESDRMTIGVGESTKNFTGSIHSIIVERGYNRVYGFDQYQLLKPKSATVLPFAAAAVSTGFTGYYYYQTLMAGTHG